MPGGVALVGIRVRKDRVAPRLFRHDTHPAIARRAAYIRCFAAYSGNGQKTTAVYSQLDLRGDLPHSHSPASLRAPRPDSMLRCRPRNDPAPAGQSALPRDSVDRAAGMSPAPTASN